MSTKLPAVILADFTTSLATAVAVGATTATIQSNVDDDGVTLPDGLGYFTIDGSNSSKEHIQFVKTGANLASIYSVSRQGTLTSGFARAHRLGATVTLTDFATIKYLNDLLKGSTNLDSSDPLEYDGTATISTANQLATKAYVDGVAIAGAPDSSTTVKGIGKVSVAPVSATSPIFVGDNDTRVPTQAENDALAGTFGTPSSTNKYVTNDDTTGTGSVIRNSIVAINYFGDGSDGDVTISSDTNLTRDMYYNNLTINSGKVLDKKGFEIFVKGTLSGSGTIQDTGSVTQSAGTGGTGQSSPGNGGAGGTATEATENFVINATGGAGGNGGIGGGTGGVGGSATASNRNYALNSANILNFVYFTKSALYYLLSRNRNKYLVGVSGAGGGGGTSNGTNLSAGGGGGAGGLGGIGFCLFINTYAFTGTLKANGANGSNGGNSYAGTSGAAGAGGGGGGGAGGSIVVIYGTKSNSITTNITGGTGGVSGTGTGPGTNYAGTSGTNGANGTLLEIQV